MTGASSADFERFFVSLAGEAKVPYDWQQELANSQVPRSRLIRIPTGMGKTLGVLAAWSWHRLMRGDERWPRRLVWCLPMRVLVEQTEAVARRALQRLNLLWAGAGSHRGRVGVHLLMGGADSAGDWHLHPEDCAVLIGTQDMLLSRALNRGYAAGRARWPLEFGLLSHDTLWVVDEAQLMDVGLATTAQLQAYLDADKPKGFRPRHTWWTSATLQPRWLESVDTRPHMSDWTTEPVTLPSSLRHQGLGAISKGLTCSKVEAGAARAFAGLVLEGHRATVEEGFGRITLVVCNTVERACETFDQLRFLAPE
ncbi:MAG: DEAD/DEAH box helicase [Candidatus Wallbacteria bacterium]|nr:DEAD/DEAH box helicase [Candidatus Wallbacteria bacterium]